MSECLNERPVIWSIAGTDSGGGAGLSADQRAADVFEVHLCMVVAGVTAQNSLGVAHVEALPVAVLDAQLAALEHDMPPLAIKTGLLCSVEQVEAVSRWIDRLRSKTPVALVVDPVLRSSTGTRFADEGIVRAYRELLLPRATLITPNRAEAMALLGIAASSAIAPDPSPRAGKDEQQDIPALADRLLALGCEAVCITGGDSEAAEAEGLVLDWFATAGTEGWLASPRVDTRHDHGTGCTFASSCASAIALGFPLADAAVLAKMNTAHALRHGSAAGAGAGPVRAMRGFAADPSLLPFVSWGRAARLVPAAAANRRGGGRPLGLYAIVDTAERVRAVLDAGVRTVQLRVKLSCDAGTGASTDTDTDTDTATAHEHLRSEISAAVAACKQADARLYVNDHWKLAIELGAPGVHLGQEDLLAMDEPERAALAASGLELGISTHSLWELCRARSSATAYVACGPVWPTLTKAMPWIAQGLDNLSWWCAMAGRPVVAIGGILSTEEIRLAAACGADGVCVVRALGPKPAALVPAMEAALREGRQRHAIEREHTGTGKAKGSIPATPRPSLPTPFTMKNRRNTYKTA